MQKRRRWENKEALNVGPSVELGAVVQAVCTIDFPTSWFQAWYMMSDILVQSVIMSRSYLGKDSAINNITKSVKQLEEMIEHDHQMPLQLLCLNCCHQQLQSIWKIVDDMHAMLI